MRAQELPSNLRAPWAHDASVQALVSDVDELLSYISIVKTPEVDAVRDQIERSLGAARRTLINTRAGEPRHGGQTDRRVAKRLWVAITAASLLGALIGTMSGRRLQRVR